VIEFDAGRVFHEAFWTAPDAPDWNVGGDRLWFGPERDWFWADGTGGLADHLVPPEIDPGGWKQVAPLEANATIPLRNRTTGDLTEIDVTRRITLVHETHDRIEYLTTDTLRVLTGPSGQAVSAWNVLQVPLGGVLTIDLAAVSGSATALSYRDYLAPVDPARLTVRAGQAVLRATGEHMFKIGMTARVFGGRLSYARDGIVIERTVPVEPDSFYCDGPRDADPAAPGDAMQIFEDDGHYGGYTEIEHHSPAARVGESVVDEYHTVIRQAATRPE
jgi:hypothetical protein